MIVKAFDIILLFVSYFILTINVGLVGNCKFKIGLINIVLVLSLALLNYYASYDNELIIKTFVTTLTFFMISKFIYKSTEIESISCTIIMFFLIIISELIIMIISPLLINKGTKYIFGPSLLKSIITLTTMIINYIILKIKPISERINKSRKFLNNKHKYIKYFIYIILIILLFVLVYIVKYFNTSSFIISIVFFISCLFIIISTIYNVYKNNNLIIMNNLLNMNEAMYESALENYKIFKHNLMHEFSCIKSVGNKKVNELVDSYIKEHNTKVNVDYFNNVPKGIKSVLYQKIIQNGEKNIKIHFSNKLNYDPINILSSRKYCELCECLGIVLDNAIEEYKNDKLSYIYILMYEDSGYIVIEIINTFCNSIDIDNIGQDGRSHKSNHQHVGLKYVVNNRIVSNSIKIFENKFILKLKIKK